MSKTEKYKRFENTINFRLFEDEHDEMRRVIRRAKDDDGIRKYENQSHFLRVAVMKLIREEQAKIK